MKAVVQRVSRASVRIDGQTVGEIGRGLLVLLGIGQDDATADTEWMIEKLLALRIFPDDAKNMNRSVTDISGGILVVSQFTLYGDARKGTRPSFSGAMSPGEAERFYNDFMAKLRTATTLKVAEGKFAAMMDVELVNDGPVTVVLESPAKKVERASSPFNKRVKEHQANDGPILPFHALDESTTIAIHQRTLPHWQQAGCTYFVTFRLADSLPEERLRQWQSERELWLRQHPAPHTDDQQQEFHERFSERMEQWLDAGHGECWLRRPDISAIVEEALKHFSGERYQLSTYVIMPNHVHVLLSALGDWQLEQIVHSWKSYTANRINDALNRSGAVWQSEYFDHIVRNEASLQRFEAYIEQNPSRAKLHASEYRYGTTRR